MRRINWDYLNLKDGNFEGTGLRSDDMYFNKYELINCKF